MTIIAVMDIFRTIVEVMDIFTAIKRWKQKRRDVFGISASTNRINLSKSERCSVCVILSEAHVIILLLPLRIYKLQFV